MQEIFFEPTVPKNKELFESYENAFLSARERYDEEEALNIMHEIFRERLKTAYDAMGFNKGDPEDFVRCAGERDKSVGLRVSFVLYDSRIIYRFHTDPFPDLKGEVDPIKFDSTYISFKVNYILGNNWTYKTTKHLWNGDPFTEHVIEKK